MRASGAWWWRSCSPRVAVGPAGAVIAGLAAWHRRRHGRRLSVGYDHRHCGQHSCRERSQCSAGNARTPSPSPSPGPRPRPESAPASAPMLPPIIAPLVGGCSGRRNPSAVALFQSHRRARKVAERLSSAVATFARPFARSSSLVSQSQARGGAVELSAMLLNPTPLTTSRSLTPCRAPPGQSPVLCNTVSNTSSKLYCTETQLDGFGQVHRGNRSKNTVKTGFKKQ